ncbi:MAG: SUF system NifU family Fe-S cluster assembly protein [Verrucomicrobia bacterium]|nr:SUF system NifU family Fe-S cluster assembly protein [Verrucomicrobiota bacterium]MCF7709049.1 SUF system NifU family Fe-S cluster assembly protein [Verrucomicrobiota bacterium]
MFGDLDDLYQDIILDYSRNPRNFRKIESPPARVVEGHNPLCGDELTLYLLMDGDVVRDVAFEGAGCAISKASASAMTTAVKGKTRSEALKVLENFHDMVTSGNAEVFEDDKLAAFSGVHKFPARVKCAMLGWRALESSLSSTDDESGAGVSVEKKTITTE